MSRVLLTGATGFIGGHVARALLERGYGVRALVRRGSSLSWSHPELESVEGDVRDRQSVAAALGGCDGVIHAAALYTFWAPKPELMYQVNVQGTVIGTFIANRATGSTRSGDGTCDMLELCMKVMAKDIAKWLPNPTMDAKLGSA